MKQLIECSKCKHSVERNGGAGTFDCHRYPPEGLTEWPIVRHDDWCGEFSRIRPKPSEDHPTGHVVAVATEVILAEWNKIPGISKCRKWSKKRSVALRCRLRDHEWLNMAIEAIQKIDSIPFLKGAGSNGWKANVDWLLRPDTVVKILEDQYQDAAPVEENPLQTTEQFFGK